MTSRASHLDRAQQKLAELEGVLSGLGAGTAVVDARAELEAARERLKALRLQAAEPAEEAVRGFYRRLEELTARIGTLAGGRG